MPLINAELDVCGHRIGNGRPTFVIAELGTNHDGDPATARKMIEAAAEAGADAVKFQTYTTETFVAKGNPYYEIFKRSELSDMRELEALKQHAQARSAVFFSSATDESGLERLQALNVPLIKLSSANVTNTPLLAKVAATGKPIIISAGASTLAEVASAVDTLASHGAEQIAILKCTSLYPCPPESVNLRAMTALRAAFGCPVGFSDHTLGTEAAIAAVALGACVIEKHFTLDKKAEGHDHHFSADPDELARLVRGVRTVERMLGSDRPEPVAEERPFREIGRRYITAVTDIPEGAVIEEAMVAIRRPSGGAGIPPAHLDAVVGRTARRALKAGESVRWEDI